MLLIIASVVVSCLETTEYFSRGNTLQHEAIHKMEIVCVIWFSVELLLRFVVCPCKRNFLKHIMNWLDLAAIAPFYFQLFLTNSDINSIVMLRIIRLIRVFRIFKLSRHSYSLQILGHTLRSSLSELFLLGFFLSIGIVVFSSLMYYAERETTDADKNEFTSIPASFWWAVVTMTTVGYGDFTPKSLPGRLVGTCCAICGVLCVALPIPVIVSNFSLYYSHAKARQKAAKKKRPLVIGAANALKVIESFVGPRAVDLGAQSEINVRASGRFNGRTWPGNSFESSEASPTLCRRRQSRLTERQQMWSYNGDQGRNLFNGTKGISGKCDEKCAYMSGVELGNHGPQINEGASQQCEDEDIEDCNGKQFILPTIEIHGISSSSQRSESNNDGNSSDGNSSSHQEDENPERRRKKRKNRSLNKKSKKVRQSAKVRNISDNTASSGTNFPQGRMGRRDSVFVVGFMGKKWKAKATKRTRNSQQKPRKTSKELNSNQHEENVCLDLLDVSSTPGSRHSSLQDIMSVVTTTTELSTPTLSVSPTTPNFSHVFSHRSQQSESTFARRSSCPFLQTSTFEPTQEKKGTRCKRWSSADVHEHSGIQRVSEAVLGNHEVQMSKCSNEQSWTERDMSIEGEKFQPKHVHLKRDGSFSSTSSESSPKGFEKGWARSSSPLVRQRALSTKEVQEIEFDEESKESVNKYQLVFDNDGKSFNEFHEKVKECELCSGEANDQEGGPVSENKQPGMSTARAVCGNAQKQILSERRNAPPLTIDFPKQSKPGHLNLLRSNSNPETLNKKDPNYFTISSLAKKLTSDQEQGTEQYQFTTSETTYDPVEKYFTPEQFNDKPEDENKLTTDHFVRENRNDTSSTTIESFHKCHKLNTENIFTNSAFQSRDTIFLRNMRSSDSDASAVPQYNHITSDKQMEANGRPWDSRIQRAPRIKIEKKDSGISSVESRSSIESLSSFTEKESNGALLKTISEVEASECAVSENELASSFLENLENSRSFIIDIIDESVV